MEKINIWFSRQVFAFIWIVVIDGCWIVVRINFKNTIIYRSNFVTIEMRHSSIVITDSVHFSLGWLWNFFKNIFIFLKINTFFIYKRHNVVNVWTSRFSRTGRIILRRIRKLSFKLFSVVSNWSNFFQQLIAVWLELDYRRALHVVRRITLKFIVRTYKRSAERLVALLAVR